MRSAPEVKVVYSTDLTGTPRSLGRRVSLVFLGLLNLAAASGLFYAGWWPIDYWMRDTLILQTPFMPASQMNALARMFGVLPPERVNETGHIDQSGQAEQTPADSVFDRLPVRIKIPGASKAPVAGAAAYGWQALAAVAVYALCVASGAALGRGGGMWLRSLGKILTPIGLVVLVVWVSIVWRTKGTQFSIAEGRFAVGAVAVLFWYTGLALGGYGHVASWSRVAGVAVLLSALGTGVGLWLGACCDTVKGEPATLGFILKASGVHSIYGVLLLAATLIRRTGHRDDLPVQRVQPDNAR